jgi:hypothetical protein
MATAFEPEMNLPPAEPGAAPGNGFASIAWLRTSMWSWGVKPGILRLVDGRLTFVREDGTVMFEGPVSEFHSIEKCETGLGFDICQGSARHRLLMDDPDRATDVASHAVVVRGAKPVRGQWMELLAPLVAPAPPPGVHARKPHNGLKTLLLVVAVIAGCAALLWALAMVAGP